MKKLRTKCVICNHRYVERKNWKTEEQNNTCLTCIILEEAVNGAMSALRYSAVEKGLSLEYNFTLKPIKVCK